MEVRHGHAEAVDAAPGANPDPNPTPDPNPNPNPNPNRNPNPNPNRKQELLYHWRYVVGWMGNFVFFSVGLWYMSAIALCYGREDTDLMLEGWLTSLCISWCVLEPS